MQKGVVVVVSGPSGVGKSTICRQAVRRLDNAYLSVSVTTRQKSETEVDGMDYRYVSREEFQEMIEKGLLLEYAEVFGNFYGTPKDKVEEALSAGKVIILEIDVQGGKQIKAAYPETVMIFILAPTQRALAERMYGRGREDGETAKRRLDAASAEVATAWQYYEHMVINDNLEEAVKEVIGIIQAARGAGKKHAAVRRRKMERNE
jgi:guanylate kinase